MNWRKWIAISGFLAASLTAHAADRVVSLTSKNVNVGVLDQEGTNPVTATLEVVRTDSSPQFPSINVTYRYLGDVCTHYHWVYGGYPYGYSYQVCDRWEKRVLSVTQGIKLRFWHKNKLGRDAEERFLLRLQQPSFDSSDLNLEVTQTQVQKPYKTYIVPEGWRTMGVSFRSSK